MAQSRARDTDEREEARRGKRIQPVHDELKEAAQLEDSQQKQALIDMPVTEQASLAENPQVQGSQRVDAMLNLQQTFGNRYVRRLAERDSKPTLNQDIIRRIESQRPSGKSLEPEVRSQMEVSFRQDFGDVHIHTDAEANRLAHELDAKAFTTGKDVFFREGAYQPDTESGVGLIAHELTHVVQRQAVPAIQRQAAEGPEENVRREPRMSTLRLVFGRLWARIHELVGTTEKEWEAEQRGGGGGGGVRG